MRYSSQTTFQTNTRMSKLCSILCMLHSIALTFNTAATAAAATATAAAATAATVQPL